MFMEWSKTFWVFVFCRNSKGFIIKISGSVNFFTQEEVAPFKVQNNQINVIKLFLLNIFPFPVISLGTVDWEKYSIGKPFFGGEIEYPKI